MTDHNKYDEKVDADHNGSPRDLWRCVSVQTAEEKDATDEGCGASSGQWVYPLVLHRRADFVLNAAGTSLKKQGVSVNYHSINVWFGSTLVF